VTPEDELGNRLAHVFHRQTESPPEALLPLILQATRTQKQEFGRSGALHPVALAIPMVGAAFVIVLAAVWLQSIRSVGNPGGGSEVTQEVVEGDYTLSLHVARDHFQVGEVIDAYALLTYSGPAPSTALSASAGPSASSGQSASAGPTASSGAAATVTPWGSSSGIVGFSVSKEGGPSVGPGLRDDCKPAAALVLGAPSRFPFSKSGGYTLEDPNVGFFQDYFATPELRLPAGVWTIQAETNFKPTGCAGAAIVLRAAVSVVVAP